MNCQLDRSWLVVALAMVFAAGCGGTASSPSSPGAATGAAGSASATAYAGEIFLVGRQNSSGTHDYFKEEVLGKGNEFRQGISEQNGSKDVVELVSKTPSAIGYSGMGYANDLVRMVPIAKKSGDTPVSPSKEAAVDGSYPLARSLYVYTVGEPQGALKHFLAWIVSPEGQAILEEKGYVSMGSTEMTDTAPPPKGEIKIIGSDTLVNVAQKWAEVYTQKYPDVNVQASGGGTGVGITQLSEGNCEVATASREMKKEERDKIVAKGKGDPRETTVGKDALALYVHKDNPTTSLTMEQLKEIFIEDGKLTDWSQVGSE